MQPCGDDREGQRTVEGKVQCLPVPLRRLVVVSQEVGELHASSSGCTSEEVQGQLRWHFGLGDRRDLGETVIGQTQELKQYRIVSPVFQVSGLFTFTGVEFFVTAIGQLVVPGSVNI